MSRGAGDEIEGVALPSKIQNALNTAAGALDAAGYKVEPAKVPSMQDALDLLHSIVITEERLGMFADVVGRPVATQFGRGAKSEGLFVDHCRSVGTGATRSVYAFGANHSRLRRRRRRLPHSDGAIGADTARTIDAGSTSGC